MNKAQIEAMRVRLQDELGACRKNVERLEVSARPVSPDKALGRITRMDSLNDQGLSVATLARQREKVYNLEQALKALDRPGFGSCVVCGTAIPEERLMAMPDSNRCVACAGR
jgi:DnaK suppressor protein